MAKVRTFSRTFPAHHPRYCDNTFFVEKFYNSINVDVKLKNILLIYLKHINPDKPVDLLKTFVHSLSENITTEKHHTIRAGNHFKDGDKIQFSVWSDKPYNSPQIRIYSEITVETFNFSKKGDEFFMPSAHPSIILKDIAANDGLCVEDFKAWFNKPFEGQIICWQKSLY